MRVAVSGAGNGTEPALRAWQPAGPEEYGDQRWWAEEPAPAARAGRTVPVRGTLLHLALKTASRFAGPLVRHCILWKFREIAPVF